MGMKAMRTIAAVTLMLALAACGGGGGGSGGGQERSGNAGDMPMGSDMRTGSTQLLLPSGHGLSSGSITVQPGATAERGNVAISCPAGGAACTLTVAADGTASFERTGGTPTVAVADMAPGSPVASRPAPQQVTFRNNGNELSINTSNNTVPYTVVDGGFVRAPRAPGVTWVPRTDYPVFDRLYRSLSEAQEHGDDAWYFYGKWSDTTHWSFGGHRYEPMTGKHIARFGVSVEEDGFRPWAATVTPLTPFADSPSIQDEMSVYYDGTLVGVTRQSSQPLGAKVDIDLELGADITGTASFTNLSTIERDGSLKEFLGGSLTHDIAVVGNTFTTTGGDPGTVTGIFAGETHAAAAGTVEHPAFVGAFSAERDDCDASDSCDASDGATPPVIMDPTDPDPLAPVISSDSVAAIALPVAGSVTQSSDVSQGVTANPVTASVSYDGRGRLTADITGSGWRIRNRDADHSYDFDFVAGGRNIRHSSVQYDLLLADGSYRLVSISTDRQGLADRDYLVFGSWEHGPGRWLHEGGVCCIDWNDEDEGFSTQYYKDREIGIFVDGSDPFRQADIPSLTGTATYEGFASAAYVDTNIDPQFGWGKEASLLAEVTLTASFGSGSENGTVSGTIRNFQSDYDPEYPEDPFSLQTVPTALTLRSAPIGNSHSGFFTGDTAMTFDGSSFSGKWGGQFYGNGQADGKPGSTAGTFGAATPDGTRSIRGGFGAYKR